MNDHAMSHPMHLYQLIIRCLRVPCIFTLIRLIKQKRRIKHYILCMTNEVPDLVCVFRKRTDVVIQYFLSWTPVSGNYVTMPKNSVSPLGQDEQTGGIESTPENTAIKSNVPLNAFSAWSEDSVQDTMDTISVPNNVTRVESMDSNELLDEEQICTVPISEPAPPIIEESAEELLRSIPPTQNFPHVDGNINTKVKMHPQATLEALRPVAVMKIRQTNRDKEDFANVPNHYEVVSAEKGIIFNGQEETQAELRVRVSTSTNRSQPFTMIVHDVDTGDPVLKIQRNGFNDSPTQVIKQVSRLRQEEIGVIVPDVGWNIVRPSFTVVDETGNSIFRIVGPGAPLHICNSSQNPKATFEVRGGSNGKDLVAIISKDGHLFVTQESQKVLVLKDDVTLTIHFERKDLDLKKKVMIMAAGFMLDYTYYTAPSLFVKICNRVYRMCC